MTKVFNEGLIPISLRVCQSDRPSIAATRVAESLGDIAMVVVAAPDGFRDVIRVAGPDSAAGMSIGT